MTKHTCTHSLGFPGDTVEWNLSAKAGDARVSGSIPGKGRSPGVRNDKFCGQGSLAGYNPWGCKESDTTYTCTKHRHKITCQSPRIQLRTYIKATRNFISVSFKHIFFSLNTWQAGQIRFANTLGKVSLQVVECPREFWINSHKGYRWMMMHAPADLLGFCTSFPQKVQKS